MTRGLGRYSIFRRFRLDLFLLAALLLPLPAILPFLSPGYFASHDGLHHLYRFADLNWSLHSGLLYPRWAPNHGFGYGYPNLNFYPPLAYYVATIFHFMGAGYFLALKLAFMLAFFLAAGGMYLYAKEIMGRWSGLLATAAYIYAPYFLADGRLRGALAEFYALALFPLILWACYKLFSTSRYEYALLGAFLYAALIITHNMMAFIFAPVLFAYAILLVLSHRRMKLLVQGGLALLLAFGLSAFFWLPSFVEIKWVRVGQLGLRGTDFLNHLTPPLELISPYLIYRYFPHQGTKTEHPLGMVQAVLVLLSLAVILWRWRKLTGKVRQHYLLFLGLLALVVYLMVSPSAFLWENVTALALLGFPWRFMSLAILATAILTGCVVLPWTEPMRGENEGKERPELRLTYLSVPILALVLMGSSLPHLPYEPMRLPFRDTVIAEKDVTPRSMAEYDLLVSIMGREWMPQFLPIWVRENREEIPKPLNKMESSTTFSLVVNPPHIVLGEQAPQSRALTVRSSAALKLSFHTSYFPGWQAYIDGEKNLTYPSGRLGLVTVDVPPGEHQVLLRFEDTPVRRLGWALSLASALVLIAVLILGRHKGASGSVAILLLLIAAIPFLHLPSERTANIPETFTANFENKIRFLGYDLDKGLYQPSDTVHLTLYWLALQDLDVNYKVFVHVVDEEETRLLAQSDSEPVFGFTPTTRWLPGEIVADRHEIAIPGDAQAGSYHFVTGLYLPETMQNLEILGENMVGQGNRLALPQRITVSP
ncbi:MAG: 6-pyruvoyl-tetrahydropterin synthase-related protein [Anaerolineae bacterium]